MGTRYFALIFGIVYLLIGIMGLIPSLITNTPNQGVTVNVLDGLLLGIFPVNIVHTLVHLAIGVWGILAYRTFEASRQFSIGVGIVFIVLFVMGLIPGLNVLFGLAPLYGSDIWLHLVSGIVALAVGLMARRTVGDAVHDTVDRIDNPRV